MTRSATGAADWNGNLTALLVIASTRCLGAVSFIESAASRARQSPLARQRVKSGKEHSKPEEENPIQDAFLLPRAITSIVAIWADVVHRVSVMFDQRLG
jgi:hypothetical protein